MRARVQENVVGGTVTHLGGMARECPPPALTLLHGIREIIHSQVHIKRL